MFRLDIFVWSIKILHSLATHMGIFKVHW